MTFSRCAAAVFMDVRGRALILKPSNLQKVVFLFLPNPESVLATRTFGVMHNENV
jgi:hypothetical protein